MGFILLPSADTIPPSYLASALNRLHFLAFSLIPFSLTLCSTVATSYRLPERSMMRWIFPSTLELRSPAGSFSSPDTRALVQRDKSVSLARYLSWKCSFASSQHILCRCQT